MSCQLCAVGFPDALMTEILRSFLGFEVNAVVRERLAEAVGYQKPPYTQ